MKMKIKSLTIILVFFFINSDERVVVMGADEPVYAHAGEDVTLNCSVDTHVHVKGLQVEWRKAEDDGDILVLLYAGGENRPESQDERYSGRAEFFTEEILKGNFSMKLRKVRFEDKGEFMCEVYSDAGSANTTARIAALGYSSWHQWILVLCIAEILLAILSTALLVRYYIKERICGHLPFLKRLVIVLPPIMVSLAFILWGVTEGSTEEVVTCAVVSLLNILILFIIYPDPLYAGMSLRCKGLVQSAGVTCIIFVIFTIPLIDVLKISSTNEFGKVVIGVFIGGLLVMLVFMAFLQFSFFCIWRKVFIAYWDIIQENLRRAMWAIAVVLLILVSVTIGLGVFLSKYFPDRPDAATFIVVQLIMLLIPFAELEIFFCHTKITADQNQQQLLLLRYHDLFSSLIWWFNIVVFTFYVNFVAWVEDAFSLGYFISITVISVGMSLCFIATTFLYSFKYFYVARKILVGILVLLHLILNILYLSEILESDKERPSKIWEFVFIYFLAATNDVDWHWNSELINKLRIYVYFFGAFGLPLLNSVALAVALKLKADTGKQPFDLRLIVFISGSVFLFIWLVIQMSAYWSGNKRMRKKICLLKHKLPEPDQREMTKESQEQVIKIMNHIFHRKLGMSCQEVTCSWSDGLNKSHDGATAMSQLYFTWPNSKLAEPNQTPSADDPKG